MEVGERLMKGRGRWRRERWRLNVLSYRKVHFPDGKKLLFVPKPEEVREVSITEHRLETSVIISHGMWTGMWNDIRHEIWATRFTCRNGVLLLVTVFGEWLIFFFHVQTIQITLFCSDACGVEFCVVLKHQTDIEEEASLMLDHTDTHKTRAGESAQDEGEEEGDTMSTLVISNRVQVTIHPQDTTAKGFNVFQ